MSRLRGPDTQGPVSLLDGSGGRRVALDCTRHVTNAPSPNAYLDRHWGGTTVKILPGEYHVTSEDVMLATVLGSCVAACVRDVRLGIGGINHFMLPERGGAAGPLDASARYGAYAMQMLVDQVLKLGGSRDALEAKVFGGGNVLPGLSQANVGERNADFVIRFLETERIRVTASDLLDVYARKVYFFPATGRVLLKKIRDLHNDTIMRREQAYRARLCATRLEGRVELFP
jgi:chemotaxis protein CheD